MTAVLHTWIGRWVKESRKRSWSAKTALDTSVSFARLQPNPIANPNPSPLLGRLHNCHSVDGYQWRCGRLLSPTAEPSCSGLFTDHASSYTAYFEVTELLIVTDLSSQSHSLFRLKVLCSFSPSRTKCFPTAVLDLYFLCSKKHFSAALVSLLSLPLANHGVYYCWAATENVLYLSSWLRPTAIVSLLLRAQWHIDILRAFVSAVQFEILQGREW